MATAADLAAATAAASSPASRCRNVGPLEGSVAAGGDYDSNLLIAPGKDAAGSTIASVSASGDAAIDLSESAFLCVGATIDGTKFPQPRE